ncbi:hypothetical protein EVAR_80622_1 [Eumeta japonica]|uniref:Uncharacterized protein n=1 Tax=Eumeta variegata TaxID=151549 RepID=A0A4C2A146_EUMVA|nr:hypothetical protein EVAR_80622_1 [Eumeta japonica]
MFMGGGDNLFSATRVLVFPILLRFASSFRPSIRNYVRAIESVRMDDVQLKDSSAVLPYLKKAQGVSTARRSGDPSGLPRRNNVIGDSVAPGRAIGIWSVNLRERSLGAETVRGLGVQMAGSPEYITGTDARSLTAAAR